jgi:transketolase
MPKKNLLKILLKKKESGQGNRNEQVKQQPYWERQRQKMVKSKRKRQEWQKRMKKVKERRQRQEKKLVRKISKNTPEKWKRAIKWPEQKFKKAKKRKRKQNKTR